LARKDAAMATVDLIEEVRGQRLEVRG